jgi:hypothetical protein
MGRTRLADIVVFAQRNLAFQPDTLQGVYYINIQGVKISAPHFRAIASKEISNVSRPSMFSLFTLILGLLTD